MHRAARLGTGLLGGGRARYGAYVAALKDLGKDHEHPRIAGGSRWFYCSEGPEQDWERLKPHGLYQLRRYAAWFKSGGQPDFGESPEDYADLEARNLYFVGTPEEIVHNIRQQYAEAPR